ncbi:TolC family protein [Undibacterium sp. SXout7W]|uniref:TolC family protein n=1 Tax=Undibacterium sp. SXout7W TaxID=3413049 RepID=UPI003BF38630
MISTLTWGRFPKAILVAGLGLLIVPDSFAQSDLLVSGKQLVATDPHLASSFLRELTLPQSIQLALQNNHDLQLSRLAAKAADASVTIASAAPNPTLTIQTASINPKQGIGAGQLRDKAVDSTFRIDQLIERGGKRELRISNASHLEQASRYDVLDTQRQLQIAVSAAYVDLLAAQHKLRISQENKELFRLTLTAADKRKKAGDIAGADVARVRIDALRAENDAKQAAVDFLRAQTALSYLIGIPVAPDAIRAADAWTDTDIQQMDIAIEDIIQRRSDVQAAKARVKAAISAKQLALAARTRDVSVGVQYEHYPVSQSNQLGSGNSYGVAIQIPLFTRYEFQGEIRVAEVALNAAEENVNKVIDSARAEFQVALATAKSSQEQVNRFRQELIPAARTSAEAAEFAFKNGAIAVMDVLDARRIYKATELDAINAQADFAKSLISLRLSIEESNTK